jgi:hypothetical protein
MRKKGRRVGVLVFELVGRRARMLADWLAVGRIPSNVWPTTDFDTYSYVCPPRNLQEPIMMFIHDSLHDSFMMMPDAITDLFHRIFIIIAHIVS